MGVILDKYSRESSSLTIIIIIVLMVLISLLTLILTIGLLSSKITSFHLNRVAIIVLLLSGVLAYHSMWIGQLGSGVGIGPAGADTHYESLAPLWGQRFIMCAFAQPGLMVYSW